MSPVAEDERRLPRWWPLLLVSVPVGLGAFSGSFRRTFDAWVHIFFADHYLRGWFQPWEPRWYGGFSVLSYPPLAHQLVALWAALFGHEMGFVIVMTTAMAALPFAARAFSRALLGPEVDDWVFVLIALWPTSHRFAYVYGQLPMMVAAPLGLFAMAALKKFLDHGRWVHWALMSSLVGATAAAHHVSTIFVAAGCGIVGFGTVLTTSRADFLKRLLRGIIAAISAGAAIFLAIYPFWKFAAAAPQAEIPHVSRDPIWLRPFGLDVVEQGVMVVVGLVGLIVALWKWRQGIALAFGVLFFTTLSLGMTTPLPKLLFRTQAHWLTYDKFHHWAAVWCCVLLAPLFTRWGKRWSVALAVLLLPAALVSVAHKAADSLQPEYVTDLQPLLDVVNQPGAERYRHLALGFGDQFCRLDIWGRSPSVDGDYHTARNDPLLRQSGVATLDASKYYPRGREVLSDVLARADALSLRWVFVNDAWYYDPLLESGFTVKDVWENGVTLFERDVPPLVPPPAPDVGPWGLYWGIAPLGFLALSVTLALLAARVEAKQARAVPSE